MHVSTKRNLHSHHVTSPLTHQQEVSCYGNRSVSRLFHFSAPSLIGFSGEQGEGDVGDNWQVESDTMGSQWWERGKPVQLKHTVCSGLHALPSPAPFGSVYGLHFCACDSCPLFALQSLTKVNTVAKSKYIVSTLQLCYVLLILPVRTTILHLSILLVLPPSHLASIDL